MRENMRKFGLAIVVIAALGAGTAWTGAAQAAPAGAGLSAHLGAAADSMSLVEKAQFIVGGRRHCWYDGGWHGPGWYWCGYAYRQGFGWGGPRGWNNWTWGGWNRRVVVGRHRFRCGGHRWCWR
jgi:hypothetical protein